MNGLNVPRWAWLLLLVAPPVGVFVLLWHLRAANAGSDANGADLAASWLGFLTFCTFGAWVLTLVFAGPSASLFVWTALLGGATAGLVEWSRRIGAKKRSEWISRWYDTTLAPFARAPRTARELVEQGAPGVVIGSVPHLEYAFGRGVEYLSARAGESEPVLCSRWELATLLLGPPRSGKTRSVIIPSVLTAPGPVLSTSTKLDVLDATVSVRSTLGTCWVFDPTGTQPVPGGVRRAHWTPVASAETWEGARRAARTMIDALSSGADTDNGAHFRDGGRNLLAGMLHIAARTGLGMAEVCSWLAQRSVQPAALMVATLGDAEGEPIEGESDAYLALRAAGERGVIDLGAAEMLAGTASATDREASGFWTVALRAVEVYQSPAANGADVGAGAGEWFDFDAFARSTDSVFIAASRRDQEVVAPIISAFIEEVVDARLRFHREAGSPRAGEPGTPAHLLLALDEVANIAPLHTLPQLVSEGGGQGVTVLAVFQDLSQARERYGDQAAGFLSLFGTTLLFPGCRDRETVELFSKLCGEFVEVTAERSRAETYKNGRKPETVQVTTGEKREYRPSVPFDVVSMGIGGHAMVLTDGSVPPGWVYLMRDGAREGTWDLFRRAALELRRPAPDLTEGIRPVVIDLVASGTVSQ